MNAFRIAVLVASASLAPAVHAGKVDLREYAGEPLAEGQGLVVLRLDWQRETKGGAASLQTRGEDDYYIVLKDSTGGTKDRFVVPTPNTTRMFVLPAGRWYVNEIFTADERKLPQITKAKTAATQSFGVVAGKVNFAGWFTIKLERDAAGEPSFNVTVDYGPDAVREATEAFPDAFKERELLYCPIGRPCKDPAAYRF